jgi:hypothetical protein
MGNIFSRQQGYTFAHSPALRVRGLKISMLPYTYNDGQHNKPRSHVTGLRLLYMIMQVHIIKQHLPDNMRNGESQAQRPFLLSWLS